MAFDHELNEALHAARLAGDFLAHAYREFEVVPNAPANITTEADRQAQEIILSHLRGRFPGDAFCAEEDTPAMAEATQTGTWLWVVDPIDGTRGFARKNGEFSVMVGFVAAGQPAVGVVLEPAKQRLTYAVAGGGCWRQDWGDTGPVRCRVSGTKELAEATLTQSRSKNPDVPSKPVAALGPQRVVETYSAGIKLALVARGEADIYFNTYDAFHDWDICAGHVLVSEAGGQVSGLRGEELRYGLPGAWQRAGLVASNGLLHEAALQKWRGGQG